MKVMAAIIAMATVGSVFAAEKRDIKTATKEENMAANAKLAADVTAVKSAEDIDAALNTYPFFLNDNCAVLGPLSEKMVRYDHPEAIRMARFAGWHAPFDKLDPFLVFLFSAVENKYGEEAATKFAAGMKLGKDMFALSPEDLELPTSFAEHSMTLGQFKQNQKELYRFANTSFDKTRAAKTIASCMLFEDGNQLAALEYLAKFKSAPDADNSGEEKK